jgi:hypothetical protein
MEHYDLKNPFVSARIISTGTDPKVYYKSTGDVHRGHKDFIMSRSKLTDFFACPAEWMAGMPERRSKSLDFGSLMDCLVTSPHLFERDYVHEPETCIATKTMKCVKDGEFSAGDAIPWNPISGEAKAWKAEMAKAGKTPISGDTQANVGRAMLRLREDPFIKAVLDNSAKQVFVMAEYHDRATKLNVPVKILIDLLPDVNHPTLGKTIADYKTARQISKRTWKRAVFDHSYHIQAALYLDIYRAATGEDRTEFLHVISRNVEPWQPARRCLWSEYLNLGRISYLSMLEFYCQCLSRNQWPGPDDLTGPHEMRAAHGFSPVEPEPWMIGADGVTPQFPEPEIEHPTNEDNDDLIP